MVKFEYVRKFEDTDLERKVIIEDINDETVDDIIDTFVNFLKGISFCEPIIIKGFLSAVDELKDGIKENYIMTQDDEEI